MQVRNYFNRKELFFEGNYLITYFIGINPTDINDKNIGVYFGSSITENDCYLFETSDNGIKTVGHSQSTFSNRIKNIFNLTGILFLNILRQNW